MFQRQPASAGKSGDRCRTADLQPGEVWEHNHTGVPVPTTHLRLEFPQPTTTYHVRIWRLDGTLCHESAVIGGLPRGFPVGLLPGGYRIEAVDRTRFWTGEGTFEIPSDDGSGTEREVAVALDAR